MIGYTPVNSSRPLIRLNGICSDLLVVGTLPQWQPKQTNVIKIEASLIKGTWSWKNSKPKHVFPLDWVFLANPVSECTALPYSLCQALWSLRLRSLEPYPHVWAPFYTSLMMMSHLTTTSLPTGDIMFFWWETLVYVFKCVSSNPLIRACLLVWPCSNCFYGIGDSSPGCTPCYL